MSIPLHCGHCGHAFHVNDSWAGKRIKCPGCQGRVDVVVQVGDALSDFMQWAAGHPTNNGVADEGQWYLQTSSGRQYGPVDRRLLDYWFRLGAISARSQVLREGDTQWRWASDLYPQLAGPPMPAEAAAVAAPAAEGSGFVW
jgi:hypothetical protein